MHREELNKSPQDTQVHAEATEGDHEQRMEQNHPLHRRRDADYPGGVHPLPEPFGFVAAGDCRVDRRDSAAPMLWLQRKARMSRGLSVALVYLLALMVVPLLVTLAIQAVINAVNFLQP